MKKRFNNSEQLEVLKSRRSLKVEGRGITGSITKIFKKFSLGKVTNTINHA
jgi:hypothetical protein